VPHSPASKPAQIAEQLLGAVALLAALPVFQTVGAAMLARRDYPGDLEWMEGATLVSAWRVQQGLPLYDLPASDYIPFIYPPLHAWVLAALGQVFPLGYTLGRSLSIGCTFVALSALVIGARRAGATWVLALASGALFLSCWADGGTFYDLVRTDALSLALIAWALVFGAMPSARATVASGLLLALAFTAKQHAALLGIPMLAGIARAHGRTRALQFVAASAGPALLFLAGMSAATRGGFFTWLVLVPSAHGQSLDRLVPGAQIEVWKALPVTTSAVLLAGLVFRKRVYWGGVALTTLVIVSLMRGHTGGYLNVLIPAFWVSALLPAVVGGALAESPRWGVAARLATPVVVALQLVAWQTDPLKLAQALRRGNSPTAAWSAAQKDLARYLPTAADRAATDQLVDQIAALPGRVLIPHAPWYAVLAGKEPSFALITLWDIDHKRGCYRTHVDDIEAAMATSFDWAVVPDDKLGHGFKDHYARDPARKLAGASTRTGWPVKLRQVWRREATEALPDGAAAGEGATPPDAPTAPLLPTP
jgi:hypothetical protein